MEGIAVDACPVAIEVGDDFYTERKCSGRITAIPDGMLDAVVNSVTRVRLEYSGRLYFFKAYPDGTVEISRDW